MRNIHKDMEYALRNLFMKARTTPTDYFYVTEPCGDYYLLAIMKSKYGVTYSITDMTKDGLGNVKFIKKALEFKEYCMDKAFILWDNMLGTMFLHDVIVKTIKGETIDGRITEFKCDHSSPATLCITKYVWNNEVEDNIPLHYDPYINPRPPRKPAHIQEQINSNQITDIEEVSNYETWKNNKMPDMQKKSPNGKVMDS